MVYLVTAIYVSLSLIQAGSLLKQNKKTELAVCLALMLIALVYSYSVLLNLELPTPGKLFELAFGNISKLIFGKDAH